MPREDVAPALIGLYGGFREQTLVHEHRQSAGGDKGPPFQGYLQSSKEYSQMAVEIQREIRVMKLGPSAKMI